MSTPTKKTAATKKAAAKKSPEKTALDNYKAKVEADHDTLSETTPANLPSSFKALKINELRAAADYFGADSFGDEEAIRAALDEDGITWAMYCKEFGLPVTDEQADELDTLDFPEKVEDWEEKEEEDVSEVATAEPTPTLASDTKYLIRMTRKNPYFEYKRYKFTQEKPYAIMSAEDAQEILENEDGFRQAYPKELQEFYS